MGSEYEGHKAIIRLNNKLFGKRKLSVQEARPKPPKLNPNQMIKSNDSKSIKKRKRRKIVD
jgi:RNA recognition motif-containing protein